MIVRCTLVVLLSLCHCAHVLPLQENFVVKLLPKRSPKKAGHPFVLIPGDGGTQLWANLTGKPTVPHYVCSKTTKDYFDMWLNLELFAPYVIDCWVDNMKLIYNETTGTTSNSPGVDVQVRDWGNTSTVEWIDPSKTSTGHYFATIVENAVHWGYRRGKDIRGVPFDFRKAPNEMSADFDRLKALIEETYTSNGDRAVVVIAHSMGNPIFIHFANQQTAAWKSKYIRAYVALSPPVGGSMKIMLLYASGYNFDHWSFVLNPLKCREMQRTFPSSTYLIPSPYYWNGSEVLVQTPQKNYTVENYEEFFHDIGYPTGWQMFQTSGRLLLQLQAPGVETHCVYGVNVETPASFIYTRSQFPDTQPSVVYEKGDGTVNLRSLQGCLNFALTQSQPVRHHLINDTSGEHIQILQSMDVVNYIHDVLYSD